MHESFSRRRSRLFDKDFMDGCTQCSNALYFMVPCTLVVRGGDRRGMCHEVDQMAVHIVETAALGYFDKDLSSSKINVAAPERIEWYIDPEPDVVDGAYTIVSKAPIEVFFVKEAKF